LSRVILPIASWAAYAYIGNMTVVNFTDQYVLYGAIGALQAVLAFAGELIFVVAVARLIWIRDRFAPSRSE